MTGLAATLADDPARDRIRTDTTTNLFVEAGAGSGKTRSLVDRVATLVLRDGVPLTSIAAVTFTEKAGAELRDRLRATFEDVWREDAGVRKAVAEQALSDLDASAIGTLHSFAQRILTLHPIEAGLPPLIEVLDEVGSSVAFDDRWSVLQRELLDDTALSPHLLRAMAAGVQLTHLRSLMKAFGSDWDLVEDRVVNDDDTAAAMPDPAPLADEAARLALRAGECRDPADKFVAHLSALGQFAAELRAAQDDLERYAVLVAGTKLRFVHGRSVNWPDLESLRADYKALVERIGTVVRAYTDATLRPLGRWIAERVLRSADERAAEGRLEFHDLLVLTRRLLRTSGEVRAALQHRYPRLLLDEFQDTDPIQIELAVRIAAGVDGDAADWRDIPVPPGSLFVVGDPKQSIYRFRRADIRTYLAAGQHVGERVALTTNFRTTGPVLDWVNQVYGTLIQPVPDAQPGYQPLSVHRTEPGIGPAVSILGGAEHLDGANAATVREREAADVAAVIGGALAEGWTVEDVETGEWRPVRPADIAVLLPARTSLPFLQDALDRAGIAYRAESSSLVYQASEIRDLMAAVRTIADPTDLLSCVTALRSALFGCGDDDLWSWKRDGGSFNILADVPDDLAEHPVGQSVSYLRRLHRRSRWMTPSELLGTVIADRRMLEVAATGPRARDAWRRLRFVVDQARAWSESEHGGLRSYLAWAARQGDEASRVAEAVLPETDVDAVRIMTIHSAKGLEFGMVVLSGMSSLPRRQSGVQVLWPATGGYAVKVTSTVQTNDFQVLAPLDEQMDAYERIRLMYVATTRARDHLVVSLHRSGRNCNAKVLADAGAADAAGAVAFEAVEVAAAGHVEPELLPPPDWAEWHADLEAVRAAARRPSAVSASGLEGTEPAVVFGPDDPSVDGAEPPGAAKGPRDLELPPWSKGRYGTAIGRAVHAVLQGIDLGSGDGLSEAVAAQCFAEGVTEFADVVAALVRSALGSDVVARAVARQYWRESYVGTVQDDGTVLEGIIDLLYREDDGSLVVVDYKTDAIPVAAIGARAAYYRPQIDAYRRALGAATGADVRGVLLFLHPAGAAVEAVIPRQ